MRTLSKETKFSYSKTPSSYVTKPMKNSKPITKKNVKEELKVSIIDPSELLAQFFNGVVVQIDEKYNYES